MKTEKSNNITRIEQELKDINSRLNFLRNNYPNEFEFLFIGTVYDKDKLKPDVNANIRLNHKCNFDYYVQLLNRAKKYEDELVRFQHFLHLPEFRVICNNDSIPRDAHEDAVFDEYNWIVKGREYVVIGNKRNKTDEYVLHFTLLDTTTNNIVKPTKHISGFNSSRFDLINYAMYN